MTNNTFDELLPKNIKKNISDLYNSLIPDDEFEFIFYAQKKDSPKMGFEKFKQILEFVTYKNKHQKLDIENITILDVVYTPKNNEEIYRITISGLESINKYLEMLHVRKNHVIFSVLIDLIEKDKNIKVIKKIKSKDNTVEIDDFGMRVRLSKELEVTKSELEKLKELDHNEMKNIIFRYKQRVSLILDKTKDATLKIDLTNIKMSNFITRLDSTYSTYELELELVPNVKNISDKYLNQMYKEITVLLKIINQSNFLITDKIQKDVIQTYTDLLGLGKDTLGLDTRKAQSLEIQHVVDKLSNKYAVTDKADGDRYFLIIFNGMTYLISDNLNVKNTGIAVSNNKYNNSILDGELVFIKSQNRYVYLAFDCLYNSNVDVRQEKEFLIRLQNVDEIIDNCFGNKLKHTSYKGDFNIQKILDYHDKKIDEYMEALNADLKLNKQFVLVRRKYFIPSLGGQNNEIFKYSELMWKKYVFDKKTNCPYILDGLIYHPLDQKYTVSVKESKFVEYKWKPEDKNSIDFYIRFEKSPATGKILTLYDNSRDDFVRGKSYKIINLYVGKMGKYGEEPVLFQETAKKYLAYMFLQDGNVRDLEGNIIQDNTVVEFYYNNDPNIPEKHRWVPMRTRYDKTESVQRFQKKYGNYYDVANKVWRSIANPFTMGDISILARDDQYDKHINVLRGKIDHSIIMSEMQENIYYQKTTKIALPLRNFHNFIKTNMIYTYINKAYNNYDQLVVLDIGCGRGGDILKFYYGESVKFLVGIDVDNNGLISPIDGALSRYNKFKKSYPKFPPMYFINANGGVLLYPDEQERALGSNNPQNTRLMEKFFSREKSKRTQFDRINCQFAVHYFFENDIMWGNFLENLNMYLKEGGYLLLTTFDGDKVVEAFGEKDQYTLAYTDENGKQEVFFDLVKKFDKKPEGKFGTGFAIDVYNSMINQEGNYITEFLVQKDFLITELDKKCNLELVDTDLLGNQFTIHEDFFKNYAQQESKADTLKFLDKVVKYYDQKDEVNKVAFNITKLNRQYVFRKRFTNNKKESSEKNESPERKESKKKKGGQKGGLTLNYVDVPIDYALLEPFVKRELDDMPEQYTFLGSVHDILKNEKIIPESLELDELCSDLEFEMIDDKDITRNSIIALCKSVKIGHEVESDSERMSMALNGVNVIVIEKTCDGDYQIKVYSGQTRINSETPSILLYYEGGKYYPIYKVNHELSRTNLNDETYPYAVNGIFDTKHKLIKTIISRSGGYKEKSKHL